MAMTRTDWDTSQANRGLVLGALRDNPGDYFSAREILSFLTDSAPDLSTLQIGKILLFALEDGLVAKQKEGNQHIWAITDAGLAWEPQPYDWRREKRTDPPSGQPKAAPAPEALSAPSRPRNGTPVPTPAPTHPWVAHPAVAPHSPKPAPITRPLPIHLESPAMTTATSALTPEPVGTDPLPNPPSGLSLTDLLIAEAEHRLAEHTEKTCCGNCHSSADDDVVAEAEEARERYIQLLLAYSDRVMERDPVWQAIRCLAPAFGLEKTYA